MSNQSLFKCVFYESYKNSKYFNRNNQYLPYFDYIMHNNRLCTKNDDPDYQHEKLIYTKYYVEFLKRFLIEQKYVDYIPFNKEAFNGYDISELPKDYYNDYFYNLLNIYFDRTTNTYLYHPMQDGRIPFEFLVMLNDAKFRHIIWCSYPPYVKQFKDYYNKQRRLSAIPHPNKMNQHKSCTTSVQLNRNMISFKDYYAKKQRFANSCSKKIDSNSPLQSLIPINHQTMEYTRESCTTSVETDKITITIKENNAEYESILTPTNFPSVVGTFGNMIVMANNFEKLVLEKEVADDYDNLTADEQEQKRLNIMRALGKLAMDNGITLSQKYNVNSDYHAMKQEYESHTGKTMIMFYSNKDLSFNFPLVFKKLNKTIHVYYGKFSVLVGDKVSAEYKTVEEARADVDGLTKINPNFTYNKLVKLFADGSINLGSIPNKFVADELERAYNKFMFEKAIA